MATTAGGEIIWDLDLNSKKFDSGIKQAKDNISGLDKAMGKAADGIRGGLSSVDKAFRAAEGGSQMFLGGITSILAAGASFAGFGIKMAADIETMTQGFVTLLGSTEKADAAIAMIKKDAAQTPFELPGLINANQLLTSVTKDANRSETLLLNIGKALTAMGKGQPELDRIIVNLQQIGAVGKASMIDIKQFAFAGIPIFEMLKKKLQETGGAITDNSKAIGEKGAKLQELKDKLKIANQQMKEFNEDTKKSTVMMKKNQIQNYKEQIASLGGEVADLTAKNGKLSASGDDLENMIADGQVTFGLLEEMFNEAGTGAGQFAKAFELQGGTFNQLMSNFKDNLGIAAAEIVKQTGAFDLVKKALSELVTFIGTNTPAIIQGIKDAFAFIQQNGPVIAGIIAGGIAPALYGMAAGFIAVAAPLIPFIAAGAAIALLLQNLSDRFGGFNGIVDKIRPVLTDLGKIFTTWILPHIQELWKQITNSLLPALKDLWTVISPLIIPILKVLGVILGTVLIVAINAFIAALRVIIGVVTLWAQAVKSGVESVYNIFKWLFDVLVGHSIIPDLINAIAGWFKKLPDLLKNALSGLVSILTKPFTDAWNSISKIADKIKDAMDKINPFHRNSPSLVDNVKAGLAVIKGEFQSLKNLSIDSPGFDSSFTNMITSEGFGGGGKAGVTQNIDIKVDRINDQQDVEALGREFGFRANLAVGS